MLAEDARARVEISIPAEEWGQQASIADAERLVVVGRGIGSKKNLPLMRRLAEALGAELGCTRPVVEPAGWSIAIRLARPAYRFRPSFS